MPELTDKRMPIRCRVLPHGTHGHHITSEKRSLLDEGIVRYLSMPRRTFRGAVRLSAVLGRIAGSSLELGNRGRRLNYLRNGWIRPTGQRKNRSHNDPESIRSLIER